MNLKKLWQVIAEADLSLVLVAGVLTLAMNAVKGTKLKVQAAINEDLVRVSGKDRDTLQEVMAVLKERELDIDMQFINYR